MAGWEEWTASALTANRGWFLRTGEAEVILERPDMRVTTYLNPAASRRPITVFRAAVVETPTTVLFIEPNIGQQTYLHDGEALARLATSFRPFEPADEQ